MLGTWKPKHLFTLGSSDPSQTSELLGNWYEFELLKYSVATEPTAHQSNRYFEERMDSNMRLPVAGQFIIPLNSGEQEEVSHARIQRFPYFPG